MGPFYGWGLTTSRLHSHYEEAVYSVPLSSQKFLVLIWLTMEWWKAELNMEPPKGFEHGTLGLGIQQLNHYAIAPNKNLKIRWFFHSFYKIKMLFDTSIILVFP